MTQINIKKSFYPLGYTKEEILEIIKEFGIKEKDFNKKFGVNTCAIEPKTGKTLYYYCDVVTAIRCCLEKRDKYSWEWD